MTTDNEPQRIHSPAMRAFIYIADSGQGSQEAQRLKRDLTARAVGMGIRILDTFVEEGEAGPSGTTPALSRLLDALWRNDGVAIILGAPETRALDALSQRLIEARIADTDAQALYV